ncbi:uncharacterized protein LOC103571125 [Microplitis demolitor]|uniref:uncharacterized protein LOC103571125 n=1 Tax=Microplitis demolitor TaxID=69319 RepID=UPI00043FFEDD|nr:uncharacterized protein LOC103571125 [Microplitis demolitor]
MKILVTVITYLLLVSFIYVNCVENTTKKYDYSIHVDRISLKDVKFPCRNDTRCIQVYNDSICANGYCWCRDAPGSKPYYCNLEHVTLYPKLFGVVGRICKHDGDCGFDNGFCNTTRHQCFCNPEFTADTKRHKCLPIVKNISGACEDNTQCHAGIPNSKCHNKICECEEGYHFVDNKCWKTAAYLEPCSDDNECFFGVKSDPKGVKCINNVCNCTVNYFFFENTCSGADILNYLSVIGIILLSVFIFICT